MTYASLPENGLPILPPQTQMLVNQYLESPSKRFRFIFQNDANFVLYDGATPVWIASTDTPYTSEVYPQRWHVDDIDLAYISYTLGVTDLQRDRIWNTVNSTPLDGNTAAAAARAYLQVQDDGNLVIVDAIPVWASNTSIPVTVNLRAVIIPPGTSLAPGDSISSGTTQLYFQADGNLVLYGAGMSVLWASYTQNKGATVAVMQADGNFVIYDANNQPLWYTGTGSFPGAYARIQANGSFSIVTDKVVWARFGFVPEVRARKVYYPNRIDLDPDATKPYDTFLPFSYYF